MRETGTCRNEGDCQVLWTDTTMAFEVINHNVFCVCVEGMEYGYSTKQYGQYATRVYTPSHHTVRHGYSIPAINC